ncbi:MAG: F0F1 ATP synthase subunit delta [Ferrovum sp.]|nr:F0F1 ATP synthase subunit delta [Ferrovum sp.]
MAEMTTIARPYAEAVFRRAMETKNPEAWSDRLAWLAAVTMDPQVVGVIGDPRLTREQLTRFILDLGENRLDSEAKSLVELLADNHRLAALGEIAAQFEALVHEQEGILDAEIVSAYAMDEAQMQAVVNQLQRRFGKRVRAQVTVDESLLGGVSITIGDTVIDGSVRARLQQMAVALKH